MVVSEGITDSLAVVTLGADTVVATDVLAGEAIAKSIDTFSCLILERVTRSTPCGASSSSIGWCCCFFCFVRAFFVVFCGTWGGGILSLSAPVMSISSILVVISSTEWFLVLPASDSLADWIPSSGDFRWWPWGVLFSLTDSLLRADEMLLLERSLLIATATLLSFLNFVPKGCSFCNGMQRSDSYFQRESTFTHQVLRSVRFRSTNGSQFFLRRGIFGKLTAFRRMRHTILIFALLVFFTRIPHCLHEAFWLRILLRVSLLGFKDVCLEVGLDCLQIKIRSNISFQRKDALNFLPWIFCHFPRPSSGRIQTHQTEARITRSCCDITTNKPLNERREPGLKIFVKYFRELLRFWT